MARFLALFPPAVQPVVRVLLWLLGLPFRLIGWVLKELGKQAASGAKKTIAPLLWPAVGIGVLLLLLAVLGKDAFAGLMGHLVIITVACGFLWVMVKLPFTSTEKKKKKKS